MGRKPLTTEKEVKLKTWLKGRKNSNTSRTDIWGDLQKFQLAGILQMRDELWNDRNVDGHYQVLKNED